MPRTCEICGQYTVLYHECKLVIKEAKPLPIPELVPPSSMVTEEMIQYARVDDPWHFAQNLNAMMQHGYCRTCRMTPIGCEREGCGARLRIAQTT